MPSRYEPLTGIDMSEKPFAVSEKPLKTVNPKNAQYKKFSEKPANPVPVVPKTETPAEPAPTGETAARSSKNLKIYLWVLCGAALMTLWIWEIAYVRKELTKIEILKDKKLELEKQNEAIRVEIARYSGYDRIERASSEHLRLIPYKNKPGVIFIDENRVREAKQRDSLYQMEKRASDKPSHESKDE